MKIISGGQTGIDQLGLEIAFKLGIETGGVAPKGYRTETGNNLILKTKYNLKEDSSYDYIPRTYKNAKNSDGTVLFGDMNSSGTKLTIQICQKLNKPYIKNPTINELKQFIIDNNVQILNVAGNRKSKLNSNLLKQYEIILETSLKEILNIIKN